MAYVSSFYVAQPTTAHTRFEYKHKPLRGFVYAQTLGEKFAVNPNKETGIPARQEPSS